MLPRGFRCVGLMLKAALLVLPEDDGPDSRETKGALRTAWREFQAFQARSPIWRLALMAVLYTVGFMVVRLLLTQAMGIFQNVWIAGGISALVASVIVAPTLISNLIKGRSEERRVGKEFRDRHSPTRRKKIKKETSRFRWGIAENKACDT